MKILCLGSASSDTDNRVSVLAKINKSINHGLICSTDQRVVDGFYHLSLADISIDELAELVKQFDKVTLLDQPSSEYNDNQTFLETYQSCIKLDNNGIDVKFKKNQNIKHLLEFDELIKSNKSFCLYPWTSDEVCKDSTQKIISKTQLKQKMLQGKFTPAYCEKCYYNESFGETSPRQDKTIKLAIQYNIRSVKELK